MKRHSPSSRTLSALATLAAALALGILSSPAHAAASNSLQSIDVQPLPAQQLQLTLHLSGPAPQPLAFTIDNPARISLDLPDTSVALASRRIDVRSGGLDTIVAAEAKDRTRLVLNLDKLVAYTTRVEGNNIIVMLGNSSSGAAAAAALRQRW